MTELSTSQRAAAMHGIATNKAYGDFERLQAALEALDWYEEEREGLLSLIAQIQAGVLAGFPELRD